MKKLLYGIPLALVQAMILPFTTALCASVPLEAQEPPRAQQTPAGRAQGPAGRAGRGGPAGRGEAEPAEPPQLVLEREVFTYPSFGRRNPFEPLVGDASGPRFEQMELRGVIYSPDASRSVALLGLRGRFEARLQQRVQQQTAAAEAGTLPTQIDTIMVPDRSTRLKTGESWGNVRIVQIQRDHVIVDVTDFGLTERRTLTMTLIRRGGQP
jgi:hypothetical protein